MDGPRDELVSPALAREQRDPVRARRRHLAGGLLAGGLVGACLVAGGLTLLSGPDRGPGPVPPLPRPSVVAAPARVPENLQTGRVGGEWRTRELTRHDVAARLRAGGLGSHAAAFVRTLPVDPFRIRLSVYAGRISARVDHALYDAAFLVRGEGRQVELRGMGTDRRTEYVVVRQGTRLRFTFRETGPGRWRGVPAEVWQRALYTTAPFTPLGWRR